MVRDRKNEEKIKRERTESILKELIPEAISTLADERIIGIGVINVVCSKGRNDARVFLDSEAVLPEEKNTVLKQLSKARAIIEEYCASEQGWFRTPKLTFLFDETYQHERRIEELFKKAKEELNGINKN